MDDLSSESWRLEELDLTEEERLLRSNEIEITDEHRQFFKLIGAGHLVIFANGKAGTGKTVIIDHYRKKSKRNIVVVAPTGVAALNAKGVTINSFFRFPPRMITKDDIKLVRDRQLIQGMDMLVVDEASMVRADVVDAMDEFLRLNRGNSLPFGGVQVLLVGDMFQLPPVVPGTELRLLQGLGYSSSYFFSAKVFDNCPLVAQNFTKIFRQTDIGFIDLLNKTRWAESLDEVLPLLNQRCVDVEDASKAVITLTCTNKRADEINDSCLEKIPERCFTFIGEIQGKFMVEEAKLPSPINLSLKVGAQVMFTQNDPNKKWVNGTLGKVVALDATNIRVEVENEYSRDVFDVIRGKWPSYRYVFCATDRRVYADEIGSYHQYPLMLAWAVTIHKGQGKTLSKVKIDVGSGAFACGQVYVALSRCRRLEDIHLVRPIKVEDIKADPLVKQFYAELSRNND